MINRFDIEQPQLTFDGDKCSIHHKISTLILNHQEFMEGKLTAAIIEAARQAGVNEIYLIDRDEVKKAIVEYMQRKNRIKAEENYEVKELKASVYISKGTQFSYAQISKILAQKFEDEIAPHIIIQAVPDEYAQRIQSVKYEGTLCFLMMRRPPRTC